MIFILAIALITEILAGCGDNNPTSSPSNHPSANSTPTSDTTLNLFTWQGMFPQEVLDGFTQETGIRINYANFDTDENMMAKLQMTKGGNYDIIIADDYIIQAVIAKGLAQKLDTSKLSGWGNINPIYQGQFYDPNNEYTIPYGAGVQTIVYNPDLVEKEITGYADLWDPSLKNNLAVIANYRVINGIALKVMEESYNTENIATIQAAGQKMLALAPNIRLIKDTNLQDDLLSGEVGAAVMYSSQVTMAMTADPKLKMVFPKECTGFGIMAKFIPVNAPNPDAAYRFIDYVLRPDISAKCFEHMGYYCTNKEADTLISGELQPFLTLPDNLTAPTDMIQPISVPAEEAHQQAWIAFKSACGQ